MNPSFYAHQDTLTAPLAEAEQTSQPIPVLTIVWHPDLDRVGEQVLLEATGKPMALNRFEPPFGHIMGGPRLPLGHPSVSRASIHLEVQPDGGIVLLLSEDRVKAELNGLPIQGQARLSPADVALGAMLHLGGRVMLCLHRVDALPTPTAQDDSLVGVSSLMDKLRRQVRLVAPTNLPVLVLGESGTGKELVAQALHRLSPRRSKKIIAVNMATLNEGLAAAELFGSTRGAYTGANANRTGLWADAEGSTLFLDEIGDTPNSVQPMLLRAIETGEYRPLGAKEHLSSNVRLVAATDRALDAQHFNQPLLRRLETYVIRTPPLRARREDLGVLVRHWLLQEGRQGDWTAEVPPTLVRALCLHDWPGNVRQLGHAVRRLALTGVERQWPSVEDFLGEPMRPPTSVGQQPGLATSPSSAQAVSPAAERSSRRATHRSPSDISHEELLAALDTHQWRLKDTAHMLGVSRPSLYNLLDRHPDIRRAELIEREDIEPLLHSESGLTLGQLACRLRTPREALRRRLKLLMMGPLLDDGD